MDTHRIDNPYSGETVAERRYLREAEVEGLVTRVAIVHDGRLVSDEPARPGLRARYRTLVGR